MNVKVRDRGRFVDFADKRRELLIRRNKRRDGSGGSEK
jgi:hypothetical protein